MDISKAKWNHARSTKLKIRCRHHIEQLAKVLRIMKSKLAWIVDTYPYLVIAEIELKIYQTGCVRPKAWNIMRPVPIFPPFNFKKQRYCIKFTYGMDCKEFIRTYIHYLLCTYSTCEINHHLTTSRLMNHCRKHYVNEEVFSHLSKCTACHEVET